MRKKHLKIKLLKFQRFRDDVCFDDLNRTLHLARPSVKISGYLLSFRLKRQKNRKNRHFIHRQLAQATSTPQPAHPSRHTLAAAAAAARFWQAPLVVRSEQADQNDENRAREHCDIAVGVRHEDAKQQGACDRGGRVDVAYEYIWHIACHYIAEKAAADSSNDTDEDGEEYGRVLGNLKCAHGTGNGENTKTDRVGKQHNTAAALEKVSNLWNEHDETCEKCRQCVNRILKHCRRERTEDDVSDDTAADCHGECKYERTKNIHAFSDSCHCAGNRKRGGTDKLQYQNENIHISTFAIFCCYVNCTAETPQSQRKSQIENAARK